ncbi:hypothetical protein G3A43_09385 [Paraburkholderia aspalathi]|nr:hypothetical protein [Paraburkholderia aspalathi]MBK3780438.1 hypothetical protein [Paraburkholderia aspalathi]
MKANDEFSMTVRTKEAIYDLQLRLFFMWSVTFGVIVLEGILFPGSLLEKIGCVAFSWFVVAGGASLGSPELNVFYWDAISDEKELRLAMRCVRHPSLAAYWERVRATGRCHLRGHEYAAMMRWADAKEKQSFEKLRTGFMSAQ